jgi:hypothetical protein
LAVATALPATREEHAMRWLKPGVILGALASLTACAPGYVGGPVYGGGYVGPAYVAPAPRYYAPVPRFYAPPPRYYAPPPRFYGPPRYYGGPYRGGPYRGWRGG